MQFNDDDGEWVEAPYVEKLICIGALVLILSITAVSYFLW
jgi:hypothetical protein